MNSYKRRKGKRIYELCVSGKPAIFVPYPLAAEDHQTANAQFLVNRNAARLVKDADAKHNLVDAIIDLSKDSPLQAILSSHIQSLALKNADQIIAKEILENSSE